MNQKNVKQVIGKIRKAIYHVGVFEQSFPKILKGTWEFTRAHLVILQDCLPDIKYLLKYALDTVPVVARMVGIADQGTSDLARASAMLREIRHSTEQAVNEILQVMDRVDPLLKQAAQAEQGNETTRQALQEARGQLNLILNALQFQDITAQQIEATNALLSGLVHGLKALMEGLGEGITDMPDIEVRKGTFDPNASFDRARAGVDQADIDAILGESAASETAPEIQPDSEKEHIAFENPSENGKAALVEVAGETVSQDDIDALLK